MQVQSARQSYNIIHVVQGDFAVSDQPDTVLTTILGSCVATCLTDPVAGIGGMNHFLLPDGNPNDRQRYRYGSYAMELLINGLLKAGARKDRLVAKLFGGAAMNDGFGKIGVANGEFALRFLGTEGIPCLAQSLGGVNARRIRFTPSTGYAQQMIVQAENTLRPASNFTPKPKEHDDVTFF